MKNLSFSKVLARISCTNISGTEQIMNPIKNSFNRFICGSVFKTDFRAIIINGKNIQNIENPLILIGVKGMCSGILIPA